jgi:hypothetical protein
MMSSVNLGHTEACFAGATSHSGESRNDVLNIVDGERLRHRIVSGESQRARGHQSGPAPVTFGDCSVALSWPVGAGLATGMRQLHSCDAALLMNETNDSRQRLNVIVLPDTQVVWTDPALRKNCSCFGKHQPSTAYSATAGDARNASRWHVRQCWSTGTSATQIRGSQM